MITMVAAAFAQVGCSGPTLEEACADYCQKLVEVGCEQPTAEDCDRECGDLRDELDGKCIEEYTAVLECASDVELECREGTAVPTETVCVEEAFDLLECTGFLNGED